MEKFYCNSCKEDVTLNNGKCPKCNTDWSKKMKVDENSVSVLSDDANQITDGDEYEVLTPSERAEKISLVDIDKNVSFFLIWAVVLRVLFILSSIATFILSFLFIEDTEYQSLFLLIPAFLTFLFSFVAANMLKWKAYMLLTNSRKLKK